MYGNSFTKIKSMETVKFKTTIKCSGCVASVTPVLNETVGRDNWNVDLQSPEKILTITDGPEPLKVIGALDKAGFKAERLD